MRGSGSSRRYCFRREAISWTLASEGMDGLPESRVAWREGGRGRERERERIYVVHV